MEDWIGRLSKVGEEYTSMTHSRKLNAMLQMFGQKNQ